MALWLGKLTLLIDCPRESEAQGVANLVKLEAARWLGVVDAKVTAVRRVEVTETEREYRPL